MSQKIVLTIVMLVVTLSGCQKDFLNQQPEGELTFGQYFKTQEHAVWATNAVYEQFRSFDCVGIGYLACTDIISDDSDKGSTLNDQPPAAEVDNFGFDPSNNNFAAVYRGYYQAIARANLAIENIPNIDMDAALRARLVGECRFLRAYSYFLLVQWFGDLPLITKTLTSDEYYAQVRQPKEAVYALIERDLLDAIPVLPEKGDYDADNLGRITSSAAKGMLAKLYMVKKDFGNAEKYCLEIINSGKYALLPKYADNFMLSGENGTESLFEIQAAALPTQQSAGPGASPYNMIQGVRGIPNLGWGFNRPSDNLIAEYETGDPRREATILYVGETLPDGTAKVQDNPEIVGERFNQKAWVPSHPGLQDNGPGNIRVLRYADILLLAAEALNENNKPTEALTYLNMIRKRARGNSVVLLKDVTTTNQSDLRLKIYHERRVELAMEQHRWFDLLRWGRAETTMTAAGKPFVHIKHELLPIPQKEIDLTSGKIKQNPMY